jgi:hypothetical protein
MLHPGPAYWCVVTTVRPRRGLSGTRVRAGLGGGYVLFALARCLQLWEVNRLNPAAPRGPLEAEIAAYAVVAVGIVLFVGALDSGGIATVAGTAFRVLAVAGCLMAVGEFAVAADEARLRVPTILVLVTVIAAAGEAAIAYGWWAWSRATSQPDRRRTTAASRESWPTPRRVTQVALASAYALYALSDVVTLATHEAAGPTRTFGLLVHAVGYGTSAIGHWQLVGVLAWISIAQAARSGLVLLGIGGCILAVVPYLAGAMPPAALNIQAVASLAVGLGWLVWAAAGRHQVQT